MGFKVGFWESNEVSNEAFNLLKIIFEFWVCAPPPIPPLHFQMLLSFLLRELFPHEHSLTRSAAALQNVTNLIAWSVNFILMQFFLGIYIMYYYLLITVKCLKLSNHFFFLPQIKHECEFCIGFCFKWIIAIFVWRGTPVATLWFFTSKKTFHFFHFFFFSINVLVPLFHTSVGWLFVSWLAGLISTKRWCHCYKSHKQKTWKMSIVNYIEMSSFSVVFFVF